MTLFLVSFGCIERLKVLIYFFIFLRTYYTDHFIKPVLRVKSMQRSGTGAIRTQLQPSKPKREIASITKCQNTKIAYFKPSEQLFPKRWSLSNRIQTKYNMNTRKSLLHTIIRCSFHHNLRVRVEILKCGNYVK